MGILSLALAFDLADPNASGVVSIPDGAALESSARRTGIAFARADLSQITTRTAFLDALGRALQLRRGFDKDWDSLYDALTDFDGLEPAQGDGDPDPIDGTVLLLDHAGAFAAAAPADWHEAIAVLRAAAEDWKDDEVPFWVFVTGAGALTS